VFKPFQLDNKYSFFVKKDQSGNNNG